MKFLVDEEKDTHYIRMYFKQIDQTDWKLTRPWGRRQQTTGTQCNNIVKMSTLWNFMIIFGIIMKNAFIRVQTCFSYIGIINL